MPRTKAVATPGTNAAPGADLEEAVVQEGVKAEVAMSEADKLRAELAELRSMVKTLGRNQAAQAGGEKVELPELEAVMAQKPTIPMLTKQGWYVPAVHPTDRIAKV